MNKWEETYQNKTRREKKKQEKNGGIPSITCSRILQLIKGKYKRASRKKTYEEEGKLKGFAGFKW